MDRIAQAFHFLRQQFQVSPYMDDAQRQYRLAHTLRVVRIGRAIARQENLNEEALVLGCLLHDIGYSALEGAQNWQEHGRTSARLARPFLLSLGLEPGLVEEVCYGIAIHVDDKADFEGEATVLARSIADSDNIDRFDAYRIYETLEKVGYSKLAPEQQRAHLDKYLNGLTRLRDTPFATRAATGLWRQRLDDYLAFYQKLLAQLEAGLPPL